MLQFALTWTGLVALVIVIVALILNTPCDDAFWAGFKLASGVRC